MDEATIGPDRNGKILRINDAAEPITGWRAEAAVGRRLAEVFQMQGDRLLARDRRLVLIEGGAEAVRNRKGGLQEVRLRFTRRPETEPPLDAA